MPDTGDNGGFDFRGTERFRVVQRIGDGGMGVVYEAVDGDSDERIAVKTLKSLSADTLLRFKQEFRSLRDLRHPNLVSLGELIEDSGNWFFTMELVNGVSFLEHVRVGGEQVQESPPPIIEREGDTTMTIEIARPGRRQYGTGFHEARLRGALAQLASGLSALHAVGKVHRDIKPSNIRVAPDGRVVLLDFGLVRDYADVSDDDFTGADHIVGTVRYMAPEQAAGDAVGPAADWYSVGALLYQSLTGRLPFDGPPMQVLLDKQRTRPTDPRKLVPGLPDDLADLCVDLLAIAPAERPSGPRIRAALNRSSADDDAATDLSLQTMTRSSVFVGRGDELEVLRDAYQASRRGAPVTLLVRGESGIGKSALVQHFTTLIAAQEPQLVALAGRCFERESVPYKALDEVMDALSRLMLRMDPVEAAGLMPTRAALLADVFPVLRRVELLAQAPRPVQDTPEPRELRATAFRALRELFTRLGERRPLVLMIDDLQWADADSITLLSEILRPPEAPPLLLIATMRSDEPGTAVVAAALPGDVRNLDIEPLDETHARELADILLRFTGTGVGDHAASLASEAAGHPLFIHELVRHFEMFGGDEYQPLPLEEALCSRIDRLGDQARAIVEVVALANGPIAQERVALAAEIEFPDLARQLASLRIASLVRVSGNRRHDTVETYHDRIRRAAVGRMTEERRVAWHRRLALALEGVAHPDAEALAVHWGEAGDRARAARYAVIAAEQASAALAFDQAAARYRRALELLPDDDPRRQDIYVKLGDAFANRGRGAEAADAYRAAIPTANKAVALELQRLAAEQLLRCGHIDEGLASIREVLDAVHIHQPRTGRRMLLDFLWHRLKLRLRGLSYEPRDASELSEAELRRIDICWSVAAGLSAVDPVQSATYRTHGLMLALDAGEQWRISRALAIEAVVTAAGGPLAGKRATALVTEASRIANSMQDPHAIGLALGTGGMVAYLLGDLVRAREDTDLGAEILRNQCAGAHWELANSEACLLWALFCLGELRELARRVPAIIAEARDRGDLYAAVSMRHGLPNFAWLVGDDVPAAVQQADEASEQWTHQHGYHLQHYYELIGRTHIELYRGRPVEAWAVVERGWPPLAGSFHLRIVNLRCEARLLRGRAALAAAAAGHDPEAMLCDAARQAHKLARERLPWAAPGAALLRAGIAHLRGEHDHTVALLRDARAGFDASHYRIFGMPVRARLAQLCGDEASAERVQFEAWCEAQGVAAPDRVVATMAPGFD